MPFMKETASRVLSRSWATPCDGREARTWSVQGYRAKHSAVRPGVDRGCSEHVQPFSWCQDCWLRPSAEHTGEPSIQPKPGDQQLGYDSYCLCLFVLPFYSPTEGYPFPSSVAGMWGPQCWALWLKAAAVPHINPRESRTILSSAPPA